MLFSTAHVKHFKYVPVQTTEWNCFAEDWTCTTIAQEMDHTSKSIYPTHKIIISLDRGSDGLHSDIKLHAEKCLYQTQLHQNTPGKSLKLEKILLSLNFSNFSGQNTFYFIRIDSIFLKI